MMHWNASAVLTGTVGSLFVIRNGLGQELV